MKNKGIPMTAKRRAQGLAFAVSLALGTLATPVSAKPVMDWNKSKLTRPNAIIGSDADAIIGSDADAIIGSDADAIIGSDAQAIIGSDRQKAKRPNAIIGSDADAIIGSDADAIIGSDADAIIGSDADAIIGSDADAIIGSDLFKGIAKDAVVQGPIEKINIATGHVTILGQTYQAAPKSATLARLSSELAGGQTLIASVFGKPDQLGRNRAERMLIDQQPYVPGVNKVMVAGRAANVSVARGTFTLGKLVVDYTGLLSSHKVDVKAGDFVTVVGVQSSSGAPLQAYGVRVPSISRD